MKDLKGAVRMVENFPKPGISFIDITTVLKSTVFFKKTIDEMAKMIDGIKIDKIVGIDARGFIFASALAYKLDIGLVIARKKGKLPSNTVSCDYGLEYGQASIEIHADSIEAGEKVLIIDDVLATGGTAGAAMMLVEKLGGEVAGLAFFAEIVELEGRAKLNGSEVMSLLHY